MLIVRAVKTTQGDGVDVFSFFLYGSDIVRVADISRIVRDEGELKGFQRKEIRSHVNSIVEFLDSGPVLFPNAIILALSPEVEFKYSRGSRPEGFVDVADSGTLTIPVRDEGRRVAWIVDGQQRSLALARAKDSRIPVPVIAFVSADLEIQREQFILVNKAKPLPNSPDQRTPSRSERSPSARPRRTKASERTLQYAEQGSPLAIPQIDPAGVQCWRRRRLRH